MFVNSINPKKGIEQLIDAMNLVFRQQPVQEHFRETHAGAGVADKTHRLTHGKTWDCAGKSTSDVAMESQACEVDARKAILACAILESCAPTFPQSGLESCSWLANSIMEGVSGS